MELIRSFFKRITDDLKHKKLLPLKLLFFVHASTLFVLYPYLTIHMRELGISVEETAIMSAVTPVVSIVMPPLAGMLADKIGNFRLLLALSSVLGGASALLLLAVPVGRITVTFPPAVELLARCESNSIKLQHIQDYPCTPMHPFAYDVNMTVVTCGFVCELPSDILPGEIDSISHSQSYDVRLHSLSDSQRLIYRHSISQLITNTMAPKKDHSNSRIMTNDPYFNTTISKTSDGKLFFPAPRLYRMDCSPDSNATCFFGSDNILGDIEENFDESVYRVRVTNDEQKDQTTVTSYSVQAVSSSNRSDIEDDYSGDDSTMCQDYFEEKNALNAGAVQVTVGKTHITQCSSACVTTAPRKSLCDNQKQQIELDPVFTFWVYLAVRVLIGIISGTAFAMFEGAVIAIVREQDADYGLQRVYGSIGGMISSPLSGLLIDYASRGKGYTDFRPAFYLYAVLKTASAALMLSIDLEFKQPAQNLIKDVITVLKNVEMVALFVSCFVMGTAWGYIESFLFWLLQDMGASRSLMGITITVGGVAGLPLLVLSGPIIRKLGHSNVIFIGFVFYAIRLLGYSVIYNPWLCLIFEALESVTFSLSFTAAVTYAARLSSTTTDTSVQALLGGLYYGVGKGSGSLIGGYLMKAFGTRPTYQIFSGATLITGCVYLLFNLLYIRRRKVSQTDDDIKIKPTDLESRDQGVKELDKINTDVITKTNKPDGIIDKIVLEKGEVISNDRNKLVGDNTDGSSDSGVDNPAYNDTESSTNDIKRENNLKIN